MANKRPKPEEIITKLRQAEVLMRLGTSPLDVIRQIGGVEQTYYGWQCGGTGYSLSNVSAFGTELTFIYS